MNSISLTADINLTDAKRQSDESLKILSQYGFVVDMSQWLTIKRYAEKYGVSTQNVTNWISQNIIPADCVQDLPELNNIRLVKDQAYKPV